MNKLIKAVGGAILIVGSSVLFPSLYAQAQTGWVVQGSRLVTSVGIDRIGFGVTDPTAVNRPLTVQSLQPANPRFAEIFGFKDAVGGNRWHLNLYDNGLNFVQTNIADYRLFLAENGNMGVGTGVPAAKLEVAGGLRLSPLGTRPSLVEGTMYYDSGSGNFQCAERIGGSVTWVPCGGGGGTGGGLFTPIAEQTIGFLARYEGSNQVGPGIVSDNGTKLIVNGDVEISSSKTYRRGTSAGISQTCSGGQVLTNQVVSGGIVTGGTCGAGGGTPTGGDWIKSGTTLSTDPTINQVGIGVSNPNRPLTIKAIGTFGEWITLRNTSGNPSWHLNNTNGGLNVVETGAPGGDGRLFVKSGGGVGVGTTSPGAGVGLEISSGGGRLRLRGGNPGGIDLFPAIASVGSTASGDSLCSTARDACIASWDATGNAQSCSQPSASRALCAFLVD